MFSQPNAAALKRTYTHTHTQKIAAVAFPRLVNMKLISGGAVSDDLKIAALFASLHFGCEDGASSRDQ